MNKHYGFQALYEAQKKKIEDRDQLDQKDATGRPDGQILDGQTATLDGQTASEKVDGQTARRPDGQSVTSENEHTQSIPQESSYPSRKDRHKLTLRIPDYKAEKYKMWCFINKINLQDAIEIAMDWLTGRPDGQSLTLDGQTARRPRIDHDHDDLIDDKLSSIMQFYTKWTGNKPTEKDKEAYKEVSHFDTKVIQTGILMSISRAKTRIHSFKYCIPAMQEAAQAGATDLDGYMEYIIKQIKPK